MFAVCNSYIPVSLLFKKIRRQLSPFAPRPIFVSSWGNRQAIATSGLLKGSVPQRHEGAASPSEPLHLLRIDGEWLPFPWQPDFQCRCLLRKHCIFPRATQVGVEVHACSQHSPALWKAEAIRPQALGQTEEWGDVPRPCLKK